MSEVLFLGGPWHRQRHPAADPLLDSVLVVPECSSPVIDTYAPIGDPGPEPVAYSLRELSNGQPVYVAPDYPACDQRPCVVPDCGHDSRLVFIAAESGRLAGRDWRVGGEIRLCPAHGLDVRRAQGVYGLDQPDARLEPLDAFDAEVSYDAADWADSRRRMLAVRRGGAGFSGTSATAGRATGGPAAG